MTIPPRRRFRLSKPPALCAADIIIVLGLAALLIWIFT